MILSSSYKVVPESIGAVAVMFHYLYMLVLTICTCFDVYQPSDEFPNWCGEVPGTVEKNEITSGAK